MRDPRRSGTAVVAVAVFLFVTMLTVAAGPASATKFVQTVIADADDNLDSPRDVAVNQTSVADGSLDPLGASTDGYVYMVDQDRNEVKVFNANGQFRFMFGGGVEDGTAVGQVCDATEAPCAAGVAGGLGGMLQAPQGVVVDQSSGNVFVRERPNVPGANARVQEFTAAGAFVRIWGWDVVQEGTTDDTAADEFETCFAASECQPGTVGAGLGQFGTTSSFGTGIDVHAPSGDVFVSDPGNQRVQRFDVPASLSAPVPPPTTIGPLTIAHIAVDDDVLYAPVPTDTGNGILRYDLAGGAFIDPIPVPAVTGSDPLATTSAMEIDFGSGNLLLARERLLSGGRRYSPVLELGNPDGPVASIMHVDTHVANSDLFVMGIGLDSDDGKLYMASITRQLVLADDGPAPPAEVSFLPYSGVTPTAATVNVTVDPAGSLATSYRVQTAPSSDPAGYETVASGEIPGDSGVTEVSADLTGLRPGTLYLVRIVTAKQFGNPEVVVNGPVLLTSTAKPGIAGVRAAAITDSEAKLVGQVNPNGSPTRYRYEWGKAGNGFDHAAPVPDGVVGSGFGHNFVSESLTGLLPGTTYNFRLVATSDTLGASVSATETFTTLAAAPAPLARSYELVSPADKVGGVGVGEWYKGPGSMVPSGFASHENERFAAEGSFGSMLLDTPQAYANDWAFADRVGDRAGWISHSPLVRPNLGGALASFVIIRATSADLSRIVAGSNNTLKVFPELAQPVWVDTLLEVPFIASWGGLDIPSRWEFWGPTEPTAFRAVLTGTTAWIVDLSADGSRAIGVTQMRTPPGVTTGPIATVRGVSGPGDPTSRNWPDLISGRSVYMADTSGQLADSFAGTGDRELVNVCTGTAGLDRTLLPGVDASGRAIAAECPDALPGRDARLVSDRGAAVIGDNGGASPLPSRSISDDGKRIFFMSPDPGAGGVPDAVTSFCDAVGETCPPQLYVRQENGDGPPITRWLSHAEGSLLGAQDAKLIGSTRFEGATADGDKVLFRTNSPLTADDPNGTGSPAPDGGVVSGSASNASWDLYLYDFPDDPDADPGTGDLIRISGGSDGDGDCNSPFSEPEPFNQLFEVDRVAALRFMSEDATRIYFTCARPLDGATAAPAGSLMSPADGSAPASETNLYLYDANQADQAQRWRFITQLPRSADGASNDVCASTGYNPASPFGGAGQLANIGIRNPSTANCVRGNPDGSFVTWFTTGALTADDSAGDAAGDLYGYDAESAKPERISAPQGGVGGAYVCAPASLSAALCNGDPGANDGNVVPGPTNAPLNLASGPLVQGSNTVFFQSLSRLVPEDTDQSYDVYEWQDGELSLITTGTSDHALYKGNDRAGRNVYFATRDSLTWQDFDTAADIYTARVDGGIEQPDAPLVCGVLADGCQGAGSDRAPVPGEGTSSQGPGNPVPGARPRLTVATVGVTARRAAVRRGVLKLTVSTTVAGRMRAVARARITRRMQTIGSKSVTAKAATKSVVRLRLSAAARQRLRAGHRLRVVVGVTMAGARKQTLTVPLTGADR